MADSTIALLSAAAALDGTELYYGTQSSADVKITGAQIRIAKGNLGYATGAGGAITQITSRITGVILNKPCGAITLFAAAPVVGTPVTFIVTNSTVAATDVVAVSVQSSNAANTYTVLVTQTTAGTFSITITSVVGTTSDSPVINFAVIKAVNA